MRRSQMIKSQSCILRKIIDNRWYYILQNFTKLKVKVMNIVDNTLEKIQNKKTRKGWVGKKIRQIHLRDDISCGFNICNEHGNESSVFNHDLLCEDPIYFVSTQTLIQQTDIICNCPDIKNLVILQSSLELLKKNNINKYNRLRNFLDLHFDTEDAVFKIYIFPDIYHKSINIQTSSVKNDLFHLKTCMKWFNEHMKETLKLNAGVCLLKTKEDENQIKDINSYSLISFLKEHNSTLLDFIGFNFPSSQMESEPIYPEHVPLPEAIKKMKEGLYFEGKYMGDKSYFKIGKNMFKISLENNRAIFGDVVIISLKSMEEWTNKKVKTIEENDNEDNVEENYEIQNQEAMKLLKYLKQKTNVTPKGNIVAIYKRNSKDFCGSIEDSGQIESEQSHIVEFKAADDKFPSFYLRTFNIMNLKGKRIIVSFDDWPSNSKYPQCHFRKIIGDIGNQKVEGDVILLEHNVEIKEFSQKAYECLPEAGQNFKIPAEEEAYRLDLRNLDVVSIDPPGCKDIDDALHCIRLPNGNLQIGVHIADVSYYVRPDSALDLQARNRCTTVYLVDRRTDMLPKLLTQNLCSLRANVERLSFSTIWQIDNDANIVNSKYCKTIIRSRNAFTYQQAQQLMDSESKSPIAESIRNLNMIAKKLKKKRIEKGALTLASTQVKISLQEETHSATDVKLYQMLQTNHLIEQFMLLANISVAEKVYERFPAISILRRHTSPKASELQTLKEILSNYGFELHYETSKQLADSLDEIKRKEDPFFNKLIRILTTRCMNQATYFCSADFDTQQFYHYGLAAQFYTHFTSPIRRYADVLVHRLLCAAIDLQPLPNFMINKIKMTKICQKMNMRNRMARYASRASSDYHIYQLFKTKENVKEQGIIVSIKEDSIKVMLISYGLECILDLTQEQSIQTTKINKGQGVFTVCVVKGKQRNLFDYLDVEVKVQMQGFHKKTTINVI